MSFFPKRLPGQIESNLEHLVKQDTTINNQDPSENIAWDMYFATIAGWMYHPGNYAIDKKEFLRQAANTADQMLSIRNIRRDLRNLEEKGPEECQLSQQP